MKKFYQISHDGGQDMKVVFGSTKYEAIGFYLTEEVEYIGTESLDRVELLPPTHEIEVSCIGYPVNKTIEELWKEKDDWSSPQTVTSLIYN